MAKLEEAEQRVAEIKGKVSTGSRSGSMEMKKIRSTDQRRLQSGINKAGYTTKRCAAPVGQGPYS